MITRAGSSEVESVIIGAGITGLTIAHELVKSGKRPVIFEPAQRGGMIQSRCVEGFTLECGPNVLVERPDLMRLLGELDLLSEVVFPSVEPYGQYVWYKERPVQVPTGLLGAVTTPLLSLGAKLALPGRLMRRGVLAPHADDESVEHFFGRVISEAGARALLDPVLKGIYGGDVGQLSARTLFPGVWQMAQSGASVLDILRQRRSAPRPRVLVIRGGIERIIERLWERLAGAVDLVPDMALDLMHIKPGYFRVVSAGGESVETRSCYLTLAGEPLAALLRFVHPVAAASIRQLQHASLGVVHLAVPRSQPLIPAAFGVLFPGGMPENLLGVMFNSQIFPHLAPPSSHLLTAIVGGAQAGDVGFDQPRLEREVPLLVQRYLGISEARVLAVTQWRRAIPQLNRGHYNFLGVLDECERECPGVVCAGVDRGGIGVSDRIKSARDAIARCHERALGVC